MPHLEQYLLFVQLKYLSEYKNQAYNKVVKLRKVKTKGNFDAENFGPGYHGYLSIVIRYLQSA